MSGPEVKIYPIKPGDDRLPQVAELFRELYESEQEFGLTLPLVEGGELMWIKSVEKILGRYAQIVVADDSGTIVGFSYGSIRIAPPHFGGTVIGYWEAMILRKEYRKRGIGDEMTRQLMDWWRSRKATVFEGERLVANVNAERNYERLGFIKELVKYRRPAE